MTVKADQCDCCGRIGHIVGVGSSSLGPISIAWCQSCLVIGAEPLWLIHAALDEDWRRFPSLMTYHKGRYMLIAEVGPL